MKNLNFVIFCILLFFLLIGFVLMTANGPVPKNNKIKVSASFYPLYYFASEIATDNAEVINLTPIGAEPHDFEPNTRDITELQNARMLIIQGSGFEPWAEKIIPDLRGRNIKIIEVSEGIANRDPHIWLDPMLAKKEAAKIAEGFIEIDGENKALYEGRLKSLEDRLDELDSDFGLGLSNCGQKNIVTSHAAFGYLAKRYGLNQVALTGFTPDEEPTPKELSEISKFVKENNIKYIFFETLVSVRLAETIAKETGAGTLVFDPIEGVSLEDMKKGADYFSVQRKNLENLRIALECL